MRALSYGICILILLLGLSFACLNADPVTINYYIGQSKIPLSLLLVMAFCGGVFLGLSMAIIKWIKLKRQNAQLCYRVKIAEQELANLRVMPLKDNPL
jgi:putative membrane protein